MTFRYYHPYPSHSPQVSADYLYRVTSGGTPGVFRQPRTRTVCYHALLLSGLPPVLLIPPVGLLFDPVSQGTV